MAVNDAQSIHYKEDLEDILGALSAYSRATNDMTKLVEYLRAGKPATPAVINALESAVRASEMESTFVTERFKRLRQKAR